MIHKSSLLKSQGSLYLEFIPKARLFHKMLLLNWGGRQETFINIAVSTNRDMPGKRDLLKVVRERTQSLLR